MTDELDLVRRAQAKARDVRDGLIPIDGLIRTIDELTAAMSSIHHIPEVTAEFENWRDELLIPDNPRFHTSRRDPVEPLPVGTIIAMVFRVIGYDPDVDGSLMARLEHLYDEGAYDDPPVTRFEDSGWNPTHLGIGSHTAWVLDDPAVLDRLAGPPIHDPQRTTRWS